jgi:hypothetical protein
MGGVGVGLGGKESEKERDARLGVGKESSDCFI